MDENENLDFIDVDELTNNELESDLLEATLIIQESVVTIDDALHTCVNLLLITNVFLALIIGIFCASILSRFLEVRR